MAKLTHYDNSVQNYLKLLISAMKNEVDEVDLISASAVVQNERDDLGFLNPLEVEYENKAKALIASLVNCIKNGDKTDLVELEADYSSVRRRLGVGENYVENDRFVNA